MVFVESGPISEQTSLMRLNLYTEKNCILVLKQAVLIVRRNIMVQNMHIFVFINIAYVTKYLSSRPFNF